MRENFLIYGAYGYTGRLIVELAVQRGYKPVVGGRDSAKTQALAAQYGLSFTVFDVADTMALNQALSAVKAVLHCGGPFIKTTPAMVAACLRAKTHYLDITGEIDVFEALAGLHESARQAGVILLPGVGFDVVPTDCLALFLKQQLPDAVDLQLAFKSEGSSLSRGTALTALENVHKGGMIREGGKLTPVAAASEVRQITFIDQPELAVTIPWGDVSTAFYSTGIPTIRVFMAQSAGVVRFMKLTRYIGGWLHIPWVKKWLARQIDRRVTGPSTRDRQTGQNYLWGQVTNNTGKMVQATLKTPEGYQLTAITALLATERVLNNELTPGFHTPASAFGPDFILQVEGTARKLVERI